MDVTLFFFIWGGMNLDPTLPGGLEMAKNLPHEDL